MSTGVSCQFKRSICRGNVILPLPQNQLIFLELSCCVRYYRWVHRRNRKLGEREMSPHRCRRNRDRHWNQPQAVPGSVWGLKYRTESLLLMVLHFEVECEKLHFDRNQKNQIEAIKAITGLLEWFPLRVAGWGDDWKKACHGDEWWQRSTILIVRIRGLMDFRCCSNERIGK